MRLKKENFKIGERKAKIYRLGFNKEEYDTVTSFLTSKIERKFVRMIWDYDDSNT